MTIDKEYFDLAIYQTLKKVNSTAAWFEHCKEVIASAENAEDYYRMIDAVTALHYLNKEIGEIIEEFNDILWQTENEIDSAELTA